MRVYGRWAGNPWGVREIEAQCIVTGAGMSNNLSYEQLERELSNAPMTWMPGILRIVLVRTVRLGVFSANGLFDFITDVIKGVK